MFRRHSLRYLPILSWLPQYERLWLRPDLIADLTVVALLIPESVGQGIQSSEKDTR